MKLEIGDRVESNILYGLVGSVDELDVAPLDKHEIAHVQWDGGTAAWFDREDDKRLTRIPTEATSGVGADT
ncbi:hypothetical protein [Mycobacteroides abscessus]|uniref:hypothetical protein n=1 Tax=Mycobacteroides abscessus TaxID=36809 RepID=UPI00031E9F6B|nr:hypothetical protein [Mycobacteroides abscessus]